MPSSYSFLSRLKEASTYAGLAAICGVASANTVGAPQYAFGLLAVVFGSVAGFMKAHPGAPS